MRRLRDMHDLYWTASGDFMVDQDELDLKDTRKANYRGVIQRIQTRLQSNKGDWQASPGTGANLNRWAGLPNRQEVGDEMRRAVIAELQRGGMISPAELQVEVFPISKSQIAVFVYVTPLGQRSTISIVTSYDLVDNKVSPRN